MKKAIIFLLCMTCLYMLVPMTALAVEFQLQKQNIVRLHVVGASDDAEDQAVKLLVRDAIIGYLEPEIAKCSNSEEVKAYLTENLPAIESAANDFLAGVGNKDRATVTLCKEAFPIRSYDTFTLPSGVYSSLRITIGEGEGKNWWCVVFPSFCIQATSEGFLDTAAGAGFSQPLGETLCGKDTHTISFFFLDCIGKIENFFHFR